MIEKFKFLCPCLQLQTMPKRNHFHQLHHILFLSLSALLFSPVFSSSSEKSSPPADAGALLDFKSKADLHNSLHFHFTPDGSSSFCRWRGVQCSQLRVVRLVLEDTNLSGIFAPDTLTRLDQLRVLSLRNDSLTGTIPDLSALVNLKALYLDHNSFSGYFPPSISNLHRIRTVDFSFNNLTGQLPTWLTRLSRLYYLRLQFNRFNGTIPPLNQSTLSVFNVSGNNLFGPIPVTEALSSFNLSAYSSNPGLCGVIIHRECRPKIPFFGPAAAAGPMAETPGFPPLGLGVGQTSQLHSGVDVTKRRSSRHGEAVIWGFSAGVFVLIGCLFCFAIAAQSRRRKGSQLGGGEGLDTMARDTAATVDAAEVMRTDEEMEEKVKMAAAEQGMKAAVAAAVTKSGSLVFCAGEAQLYTLDQLMRASAELLGRGTMGATYKAVLDNRLIVCVKRLDAAKMGSAGKEAFVRHMESVGGLRHQNLVPLRAYFQAKEERLLVYDYQANGSLSSLIHGSKSARAKPLHWTSCLKIAEDVAQGLSYIHQAWRLVHGNLKSTNVLLGSDFEACLTDYCIAALASDPAAADEPSSGSGSGSSAGYRAPEIRRSASSSPHMYSSVNSKADVYAFGVLLLELLTGKSPSQHPSSMAPKEMVKWVRSVRDVDDADEENRLIMLSEVAVTCRMSSPDQRPTMWQVLRTLQDIKEAVVLEDHDQLDPLSLSG